MRAPRDEAADTQPRAGRADEAAQPPREEADASMLVGERFDSLCAECRDRGATKRPGDCDSAKRNASS